MIDWKGLKDAVRRHWVKYAGIALLLHSWGVSAQASEAGLRVAFVYNFLKFIEWPDLVEGNFVLCAVGAQGAARESLGQIQGKHHKNLTIQVVFIDQVIDLEAQIPQCHLAYIPTSGADMPLPMAIPSGVLLVVDEPDRQDGRVGIALTRTSDDRIEFLINDAAIKQAGVKVSSQLLKLAKKQPGGGT